MYGTSHPAYGGVIGHLAEVIAQRGALDSAETLYRRAVAIQARTFGPEGGMTRATRAGLAGVLVRRRRFAEAESGYRTALAALHSYANDSHRSVRRVYAGLAALYEAWGKPDSAAVYRRLAADVDLRDLWP
jgi:serine/threonine-protein kinase